MQSNKVIGAVSATCKEMIQADPLLDGSVFVRLVYKGITSQQGVAIADGQETSQRAMACAIFLYFGYAKKGIFGEQGVSLDFWLSFPYDLGMLKSGPF